MRSLVRELAWTLVRDLAWSCCLLLILSALADNLGGVPFGGDAPAVVLCCLDNMSDKASIAALSLLPVSRNGFAACGCFNASVNSSKAVAARSDDAVVGMEYFSGKNTTVSDTLVLRVFGI